VDSDLFKRLVIGAYPPEIFVAHATTGPTSLLVRANSFSLEAARRQSKKSAKVASNDGGRRSMERTGQCHCGSLRVITTGEPDRVYLCHCQACQRRTGTAFHFGASFPKEQVRLDGGRKVYERNADSVIAFDFISARIAAPRSIGRETAILRSAEWPWALSRSRLSRRPAIRSGRSRCIRGSGCRRIWSTTGRVDHRSQFKRNILLACWRAGAVRSRIAKFQIPVRFYNLASPPQWVQSRSPPINRSRIDCSSCCR
jgi:hypothetical protein